MDSRRSTSTDQVPCEAIEAPRRQGPTAPARVRSARRLTVMLFACGTLLFATAARAQRPDPPTARADIDSSRRDAARWRDVEGPWEILDRGGPLPPGARRAMRPNATLFATGLFAWSFGGIPSLAIGLTCLASGCFNHAYFAVPIAGPWIAAAVVHDTMTLAFGTVLGSLQAIGLVNTILAIALPQRVLIFTDRRDADRYEASRVGTPVLTPMALLPGAMLTTGF